MRRKLDEQAVVMMIFVVIAAAAFLFGAWLLEP